MTESPDPPVQAARAPGAAAASVPPAIAPPPVALAPVPPVRRPGLDPATRVQTIIVAVVIAAMFWGSQILNEAIPVSAQGQVAPGESVEIGGGARITPLDGWVSTPHENGTGIRLEKGIVVIDLFPETFDGSAGDLARAYLEEVLKPDATQLTATEPEVETNANASAAQFTYQGLFKGVDVAIEGEVTAILLGGRGVIADAWSSQGDLAGLLGEIHAMLGTIEVAS